MERYVTWHNSHISHIAGPGGRVTMCGLPVAATGRHRKTSQNPYPVCATCAQRRIDEHRRSHYNGRRA